MKKQVVYKVLCNENNKLFSWNAEVRESTYGIRYFKNRIISPKIGKIFCFTNKKKALEYDSHRDIAREVWKCEATGVSRLTARAGAYYIEGECSGFWKNSDDVSRIRINKEQGIYGCDSIKLLEKIL